MPVSIEELDATVRAFYEGRGEQVNKWFRTAPFKRRVADADLPVTAKGCPSRLEPGTFAIIAPTTDAAPVADQLPQFKEDPDAWLMVDDILSRATYEQTKCMSALILGPTTYTYMR